MKRALFIIVITLIALVPSRAQSPETQPDVPKMALPDGADSWVVEIFTSGGLTGGSNRDFALSSLGTIVCDSPKPECPKTFSRPTLQPLFENVPIAGYFVPILTTPGICADCITTTMTIRRRDSSSIEQTYTVSWNVVSGGEVPPQIMRLYDAVMAARKPN